LREIMVAARQYASDDTKWSARQYASDDTKWSARQYASKNN
jgi:hypothetical protein